MKKIISIIAAAFAISIGLGTVFATNNIQPVQAISKKKAVNGRKYRRVKITKTTNLAKIHWRTPRYKSTFSKGYYVDKGEVVYVLETSTDFGWYLKTSKHAKPTYTVMRKYNDYSWFKLY